MQARFTADQERPALRSWTDAVKLEVGVLLLPLPLARLIGLACALALAAVGACSSGRIADPEAPPVAPLAPGSATSPLDGGTTSPPSPPSGPVPTSIVQGLAGLPTGAGQLAKLCARGLGDPVSMAFCADFANSGAPPVIRSLVDLQKVLGLDFKPGNDQNGLGGNPAFALTGNSSSLVARFTSAINPRAIIFTPPNRRARVKPDGGTLPQDAEIDLVATELKK